MSQQPIRWSAVPLADGETVDICRNSHAILRGRTFGEPWLSELAGLCELASKAPAVNSAAEQARAVLRRLQEQLSAGCDQFGPFESDVVRVLNGLDAVLSDVDGRCPAAPEV